MPDQLTESERAALLKIARQALEAAVNGKPLPVLDHQAMPPAFLEPGAVFVTLTQHGDLRGCIGALEAYQPLVDDVMEHAAAAAVQDYRFAPVTPDDTVTINIEISRLTKPVPLSYQGAADLISKLRPGVDGVILRDGWRRATFLPQVWDKLDSPEEFLSHLCYKMGAAPNLWQQKPLEVAVYQVEEFHE